MKTEEVLRKYLLGLDIEIIKQEGVKPDTPREAIDKNSILMMLYERKDTLNFVLVD